MAVPDIGDPKLPLTVDSPVAWAEFLIDHSALAEYYDKHNIKCFNCCAAEAETFAQGAKVHEGGQWGAFDAQKVVDDLNELAKKHPFDKAKYQPPSLLRSLLNILFPDK